MDSNQLSLEGMSSRLNLEQAEAVARARLREFLDDLASVSIEAIALEGIGWIFTYQARAFVETGDFGEALLGNAPIIVDFTGHVHEPQSGDPIDDYIADLRESLRSTGSTGKGHEEGVMS